MAVNKRKVNMNTKQDIIELVGRVIKTTVDESSAMGTVPEWDSIHNIMILNEVQQHFGIVIPDDDVFDLVSIKDIVSEVEKLKS